MDTTALFRALFGSAGPTAINNPLVGAHGQHVSFPVDSPGYMLQMLFGQNAKASDYYNPNDVAYREGGMNGSGVEANNEYLANQANGGYHETPQQYFARMTKMAMGDTGAAAPAAPTGTLAPAAPKPVVPKVVKPKLNTAAIPTSTYTPPAPETPAAPANPFQAADTYKAPEPAAPATAPLATGA
jgi:hypothetical protein